MEDDVDVRDTLCEVLEVLGYAPSYCDNGRDALDLLRAGQRPDVILLDLMLPTMTGWQFRIEQRKDPELAMIPVVVLSADGTPKAAAIDADAYLEKPVGFDALASTIERVVLRRENRLLQARLMEADRLTSLGTLAAGVAHEINNPLCYVGLNVAFVNEKLRTAFARGSRAALEELAGDEVLQAQIVDALGNALVGADRMRIIVRGLKTFSCPDDEPVTSIDVPRLLDSTLAILEHEIRPRALLVKEYDAVPRVEANEARLGQVFLNLVLNAAQALGERTEGNEVRVRVRAAPPGVVVEVHDNGCGIAEDVRGRIFEPFFTTKPVGVGTGLGLSICHGIVRSLRGELTFETQVGKGSVFRVALPASPHAQEGREPSR